MHNISKSLLDDLAKSTVNIAFLIHLKANDNQNFYFTNHDNDISHNNIKYISQSLFNIKSINPNISINFDNSVISFQPDSFSILFEDIINGKYDYMPISISVIDYKKPSSSFIIQTGNLGAIEYRDNCFYSNINSIKQKLSCNSNQIYSNSCRNLFCDANCRLNIEQFSENITITANPAPNVLIVDNISQNSGYYNNGNLVLLTSSYKNIYYSIKSHATSNKLYLFDNLFLKDLLPISASISLNCSKSFDICKTKFKNVINFAGEPYVPGNSQIL